MGLSVAQAQDYAQFADTWAVPSPSLIQSNPVVFDTGTPLNPGGTSYFDLIITNSGGWTLPDLSHPVPGYPAGGTIAPALIHPSYGAVYSTNNLDALLFRATAGSVVTFTFDFSGLPGGVLPAGAALAWGDVDQGEVVTLFSPTSGWTSGAVVFGDLTLGSPLQPGQPNPGPGDLPSVSLIGDLITITGAATVTDTVGVFIPIVTPISLLTVTATDPGDPFAQLFAVGYPFIPEPTAASLLLTALGIGWARRRNASARLP